MKLNVLTIGNSYTDSLFVFTPQMTASLPDCELVLDRANIGGCSLKRHWEEHLHSMEESTYKPYYQKFDLREKLSELKWDIVTIQQASYESWDPDSYEPYAANIIALIKEYAPQAEIIIQQTWSYNAGDHRLLPETENSWGFDQNGMFERLEKCYRDLAERYSLRFIPTGLAVQYSRKFAETPDVVGYEFEKEGMSAYDFIHLNDRGRYMQSCLWLAFLFNIKCTDIKFIPENISSSDAEYLQKCAQTALESVMRSSGSR